ncbi:MAG: DUF192 domain-containing protein [Candidatus Paceibacterota bacterium]|jgi:hypothetical protein
MKAQKALENFLDGMETINKFFKKYWILIFVFAIVFYNISISDMQVKNLNVNKIQYVKIAGKILKTELALTSEAQQKGLSNRKELKEDESMLFVFNYPGRYSFWMKDMNFPIDIIWLDENLNIVYIKKNAMPESYPESFTPNQNSKYVLEVFASFSEKNNLKEGDKVKFLSS